MRYQEISEDYDYDDDFDIDPIAPRRYLSPEDERRLRRHKARQNRPAWRQAQLRRYRDETEDDGISPVSRHPPKSLVGYKPHKTPLIRFGKFGQSSRIGFDPEFRAEMGNVTHESGVSVYAGYPIRDGYLVIEPDRQRAVYDASHAMRSIVGGPRMQQQLIDYLDRGKPMDIFLLRGHLASFGHNREYLSLGSDGEYLLDTTKPFRSERIAPERIYMTERMNLIEWFDSWRGGIAAIRDRLRFD